MNNKQIKTSIYRGLFLASAILVGLYAVGFYKLYLQHKLFLERIDMHKYDYWAAKANGLCKNGAKDARVFTDHLEVTCR
jgi:hypothetical protein